MIRALLGIFAAALLVSCGGRSGVTNAEQAFALAAEKDITLRAFLQEMPKGGDIHSHLYGAIYAESWLRFAQEDGLCIDQSALAIREPGPNGCAEMAPAKIALADQNFRDRMIEKLSMRDFAPSDGWSGHDQFFATFGAMVVPYSKRYPDMVAETMQRAGTQNIQYLELMHAVGLADMFRLAAGAEFTGNAQTDYNTLMRGPFGQELPALVQKYKNQADQTLMNARTLLGCESAKPDPGCETEVRFLHQSVREFPPMVTYAHNIFGWYLIKESPHFVGANLVAPEDGHLALTLYRTHMQQYAHLYDALGHRPLSLHAGELALGLVKTDDLRFHIHDAVHVAGASRIGHGTAIVHEDKYQELLSHMANNNILVEINLTSSDTILGIKGDAHPFHLYQAAGVPMALSTDDEGVSRIDLTHEYMRAVRELGLGYSDLKHLARNSLEFGFMDAADKARLLSEYDKKVTSFEAKLP